MATATDGGKMIKNVEARVYEMNDRFIILKFGSAKDDRIRVSNAVAYAALPRPPTVSIPDLKGEFRVGDIFTLDIAKDKDKEIYVPTKINSVALPRPNGKYLSADGVVINANDSDNPVIRSSFIPDFVCARNDAVNPMMQISVGSLVTFEALVMEIADDPPEMEIHGLRMRVNPFDESKPYHPDTYPISFPLYRSSGTVFQDQTTGQIMVDAFFHGGDKRNLPIYDGAYGISTHDYLGLRVDCVICSKTPYSNADDLEVIWLQPGFHPMFEEEVEDDFSMCHPATTVFNPDESLLTPSDIDRSIATVVGNEPAASMETQSLASTTESTVATESMIVDLPRKRLASQSFDDEHPAHELTKTDEAGESTTPINEPATSSAYGEASGILRLSSNAIRMEKLTNNDRIVPHGKSELDKKNGSADEKVFDWEKIRHGDGYQRVEKMKPG